MQSHGSHDSMPSKVWPSARRSHCSAPHGCESSSSSARACTSSVARSSRTGKDPGVVQVDRRALIGDRELRQAIDLVAPEVDAHGMVGGRRVHVDDRAAHRELAPRLDLVLASVAHRHEPVDRARRGRAASRRAPRPARPPRRGDRGAARARGPARPPPPAGGRHRRGAARSRAAGDPWSPPRATRARTAASPTPGTARRRRRRGTRAGRRRAVRPRHRSAPRAPPAGARWPSRASPRTGRARVPGPRPGRAEPPVAAAMTASEPSSVVSPARAGVSVMWARASTPGTRSRPGVRRPQTIGPGISRCSGSSPRRRRRRGSSRPRRRPLRS